MMPQKNLFIITRTKILLAVLKRDKGADEKLLVHSWLSLYHVLFCMRVDKAQFSLENTPMNIVYKTSNHFLSLCELFNEHETVKSSLRNVKVSTLNFVLYTEAGWMVVAFFF
jgi:hypothetical protein